MSNVIHLRQKVQVTKVRGWGYATVVTIKGDNVVKHRDKTLVVKFPKDHIDALTVGSMWELSGKEKASGFKVNGFDIVEHQIEVETIKYIRPSGLLLARWISANIKGIGEVIARRLVRQKNLQKIIAEKNVTELRRIRGMNQTRTDNLIDQWPDDRLHETIEFLEEQSLPLSFGEKLVGLFADRAIERVKEQPFILAAMGLSFERTMEFVGRLGIPLDDEKIVAGVAQYVAVSHARKSGSTVIDDERIQSLCTDILAAFTPSNAADVAVQHGMLVKTSIGYQVYGTALMEQAVAHFLIKCHRRPRGAHAKSAAWEKSLSREKVVEALTEYEGSLDFELTGEQRVAIVSSVMAPVSCISGGAGTGKTTILKAILGVYEALSDGVPCSQLALSGRAAQRMSQSTGKEAKTIAKFIAECLKSKSSGIPAHLLFVIDEASMVDLLSMYRLTGLLPQATRILFVGDTAQLPPVSAGLVFHALKDTAIPFFNLSQVKRQGEESGIHTLATAVREGKAVMPEMVNRVFKDSSDCIIVHGSDLSRLVDFWQQAGGVESCIVLSPTRNGPLGVNSINEALQNACGLDRMALSYLDPYHGYIKWITPSGAMLLLGDAVLVTSNNYDEEANIRNGDLGVITEVYESSQPGTALGVMSINGKNIDITPNLLEKLELGYAVTIHKSQGSQWPTCFVMLPDDAINMFDQTLLYTAVTRPEQRLVLMGDERLIGTAVARGAMSSRRVTTLRQRILALSEMELAQVDLLA
ncbi:AAA family ATPase [Lacimicrobium alkaliphilum]|uniref:ATP-dependent RecD-like DNA helicase n=1 Tax=Lacimicrobium alkaliphilum TaxID=1526571 RepID=A0ABQ1R8U9_9ALTE|nr:AAA family ATPase [Lacimicrobium alkaliphilum]GGD61626.1 ATP-dependent RecD-like DNA helicase [Lacimicrobium alkaliphilum]